MGTAEATVVVLSPAQAAEALVGSIDELVSGGDISEKDAAPLVNTLEKAATSFETMDNPAGVSQVGAFQKQVESGVKSGKIDPETGNELVATGDRIIDSAGGKPAKNKP